MNCLPLSDQSVPTLVPVINCPAPPGMIHTAAGLTRTFISRSVITTHIRTGGLCQIPECLEKVGTLWKPLTVH